MTSYKRRTWVILVLFLAMMFIYLWAEVNVKAEPLAGLSLYMDEFYKAGGKLYEEEDLQLLSAAMELENGSSTDRCLLLTGSVILNRRDNEHWKPDTIKGVLYEGYNSPGPQQYATHTVKNLYTVKVSERVTALAKQLLIFGSIAPINVVYQSMYAHQGSGNYEVINGEYFAYE